MKPWGGRHPISPDGKFVWMKLPERVPAAREGYRFLMGLSDAWRGYEWLPAERNLRQWGFSKWSDGAQTRCLAGALKAAGKSVYRSEVDGMVSNDPAFAEGIHDFLAREDWVAIFCPSESVLYGSIDGPVQMRQIYPRWYFNLGFPVQKLLMQAMKDLERARINTEWARSQGVRSPTLSKMIGWRLQPSPWSELCAMVAMEALR